MATNITWEIKWDALFKNTMAPEYQKDLAEYIEEHSDDIENPCLMFEKAPTRFQPGLCEVFNAAGIEYIISGKEWHCTIDQESWRYRLD
jgi:hypothetical protein